MPCRDLEEARREIGRDAADNALQETQKPFDPLDDSDPVNHYLPVIEAVLASLIIPPETS